MHITHTIQQGEHINIMVPRNPIAAILVSFPLAATHPYERFGKHVHQEVFARCDYSIGYGSKPGQDYCRVFHTPGVDS